MSTFEFFCRISGRSLSKIQLGLRVGVSTLELQARYPDMPKRHQALILAFDAFSGAESL